MSTMMKAAMLILLIAKVQSLSIPALYQSCLQSHPLATKACTSAVLSTVSDVLCQRFEQKQDRTRTRHVALTGLVWSGPSAHYWYATLEAALRHFVPGIAGLPGLGLRLLLDALVFSPITVFGYFVVRTLLEQGWRWEPIRTKLQTKWAPTVRGAWKFWPLVNVINFSVVPLPYRVLYVNVLSVFWTGYLTFVNSQGMSVSKKASSATA